MKTLILAAMMIANSAMAATDGHRMVEMYLDTVVDLSQEASSDIVARVEYPGLGDGAVCLLELVATGESRAPISALLEAIDVKPEFYEQAGPRAMVRDANTIDLSLILQTYVDGVFISTKDGSTLYSTVQRVLGTNAKVRLIAKGC
jgi:hypothetical protein